MEDIPKAYVDILASLPLGAWGIQDMDSYQDGRMDSSHPSHNTSLAARRSSVVVAEQVVDDECGIGGA